MNDKKRKLVILIDKIIAEPIFWAHNLFSKNNKQKIKKQEIKNILIIRPGGIGDFLLNIPAFKRLRKTYPNAKITIFAFKRNKNCFEFYDDFDKKVIIDTPKEFSKFLLTKKNYNLTIDFDQHRKTSSIISLLSKAKVRIGFKNNSKEKAYNYSIPYKKDLYESLSFLSLLNPLKIKISFSEKDLLIKPDKKEFNILKKQKNIGIYASALKENNRLPIKKWAEIIKKHGKKPNYYFIGSSNDIERYDLLEKELKKIKGFKINRVDGTLSLKDSFNLISKLNLLISEDGGVYHLGVCAGIPTLSYWLHGKNNMKKWKAPFNKHNVVMVR
tara:strand:- start:156 stop:1139 length:984 start_codon:yes stop_codon:yes gene_type:complete